ncbi:MAG: DUF3307 domain-containing protein [Bacteroidetes bacterium]|nr:DUF3307 domain-containing protein [Bacteroidota bacterium]
MLFLKLLLSHLLTDFVLQPGKWVKDRNEKKHKSVYLYLHGAIAGILAGIFTGNFIVLFAVLITHTGIDLWKSYKADKLIYFYIDQFLHLLVLLFCWVYMGNDTQMAIMTQLGEHIERLANNRNFLAIITGYVFVIWVARIIIAKSIKIWYDKIADTLGGDTLSNAGMWIGISERTITFTLVLVNQYEAIGLLIAAKSIIRFREKSESPVNNDLLRRQTEYVLIGTLLSFGMALLAGIAVKTILL